MKAEQTIAFETLGLHPHVVFVGFSDGSDLDSLELGVQIAHFVPHFLVLQSLPQLLFELSTLLRRSKSEHPQAHTLHLLPLSQFISELTPIHSHQVLLQCLHFKSSFQ